MVAMVARSRPPALPSMSGRRDEPLRKNKEGGGRIPCLAMASRSGSLLVLYIVRSPCALAQVSRSRRRPPRRFANDVLGQNDYICGIYLQMLLLLLASNVRHPTGTALDLICVRCCRFCAISDADATRKDDWVFPSMSLETSR